MTEATGTALDLNRPRQVAMRLQEIKTEINARFIEIAELLREVYDRSWWRDLGNVSFEDFVEQNLDVSYRTVMYWLQTFKVLIDELNVSRADVAEIGWTKAKEIAPHITPDNKTELIELAKDHTTNELNLIMRQRKSPPGQAETLRQYSQMTIGMFDDERVLIEEALELAKLEAQTERTAAALMLICADYIAEARARQAQAVPQETEDGPTTDASGSEASGNEAADDPAAP